MDGWMLFILRVVGRCDRVIPCYGCNKPQHSTNLSPHAITAVHFSLSQFLISSLSCLASHSSHDSAEFHHHHFCGLFVVAEQPLKPGHGKYKTTLQKGNSIKYYLSYVFQLEVQIVLKQIKQQWCTRSHHIF